MPAWARLFRGAVFRAGPLQGWDEGLEELRSTSEGSTELPLYCAIGPR